MQIQSVDVCDAHSVTLGVRQHKRLSFEVMADDDDFMVAPPPDAPPGGVRAKGRRRGLGVCGTALQKTKDAVCIATNCEEKRQAQKVFCSMHACSWRGLGWQAEEQRPEAKTKLEELKQKGREVERGEATYQFSLINPPDKKYQKKSFSTSAITTRRKPWRPPAPSRTRLNHSQKQRG